MEYSHRLLSHNVPVMYVITPQYNYAQITFFPPLNQEPGPCLTLTLCICVTIVTFTGIGLFAVLWRSETI